MNIDCWFEKISQSPLTILDSFSMFPHSGRAMFANAAARRRKCPLPVERGENISFCTIQSFWSPCLNYLVSTVQCTVAEIRRAKNWRRKASRCSTSAPTSGTILLTAHWSIRLAEAELGLHCCEWSADGATIWHLFLAGKTLAKWWTQGPLKIQEL